MRYVLLSLCNILFRFIVFEFVYRIPIYCYHFRPDSGPTREQGQGKPGNIPEICNTQSGRSISFHSHKSSHMLSIFSFLTRQVCEVLSCEVSVYPLTINYLDRFLEKKPAIRKQQLQLVGVVCLLIASKIRQCKTISVDQLCYMTDNSVTSTEILVSYFQCQVRIR